MYPRTSDTPSSCLGQVPPWTRSQAGSARAVQSAVMDRAPGRADTRLRSCCLGIEAPPLLRRPPGTVEPGGAYMLIQSLCRILQFPFIASSLYVTGLNAPLITLRPESLTKSSYCYLGDGQNDNGPDLLFAVISNVSKWRLTFKLPAQ